MALLGSYQRPILDALSQKGWNAYMSENSVRGEETVIRAGPAEILELEKRYVVLPKADDPRDPTKVFTALEKLAVKLDRQTPTIEIHGERFPWTGFKPFPNSVKVLTPLGHFINYETFLQSLQTIVEL